MRLTLALAVALIAAPALAQNTQGLPTVAQKNPEKQARLHFQGAEAALYSALAHAETLSRLAQEEGELDADIGLAHVKVVTRDINECKTHLEKMGQAVPKLEKEDALKAIRKVLDEGLKSNDQSQRAVDGHGKLGDPAKETTKSLRKALSQMRSFADKVGTKPLQAPQAAE